MPKARSARRPSTIQAMPRFAISRWFPVVAAVCTVVLWLGWFSPESYDSDFWWHLKTGQFVAENHALPVPDPFAYTTAGAGEAYAGEAVTRHFNLTHEWLAQVLFYLVWRVGGFGGVVLFRAAILAAFCSLVGLVAWRRCGGFYRSLAAACAAAGMAIRFALDRPTSMTFLLLAATMAILEFRRWLWLLPPLFLIWANCHSGFFLGWLVLAAYSGGSAVACGTGAGVDGQRRLRAASGINPNGFRIFQVLLYYRASSQSRNLLEWAPPAPLALSEFTVLWLGAALLMLWAWKRVRPVDWILFAAFAAAAFTAQRNTILIGLIAPLVYRFVPPLEASRFSAFCCRSPHRWWLIGVAMATSWGNAFHIAGGRMALPRGRGRLSPWRTAPPAPFSTRMNT